MLTDSARDRAPFGIRKDAQPPRNGAFATMGREVRFAGGLGDEIPSTSMIVATQSLLAGTVVEVSDANSPWKGGQSFIRREAVIAKVNKWE